MPKSQQLSAQIEQLYSLHDPGAVWRFLFKRPGLVRIIRVAYSLIEEHFGPNPHVTLRVVTDPEVVDWRQLLAEIRTSLPVDEALARLNELDLASFDRYPLSVDDLFSLDLECV